MGHVTIKYQLELKTFSIQRQFFSRVRNPSTAPLYVLSLDKKSIFIELYGFPQSSEPRPLYPDQGSNSSCISYFG